MRLLTIEVDDQLIADLDRLVPDEGDSRPEFLRRAIRRALREVDPALAEEIQAAHEAIRRSYMEHPDTADDPNEWATFAAERGL